MDNFATWGIIVLIIAMGLFYGCGDRAIDSTSEGDWPETDMTQTSDPQIVIVHEPPPYHTSYHTPCIQEPLPAYTMESTHHHFGW